MEPSEKELVKEIRSKVKDVLTECRDKYLYLAQEELLDSLKLCRVPLESLVELVQEFHRRFSDRKREKNILDFTDMEHFALEILVKRRGKINPHTGGQRAFGKIRGSYDRRIPGQ